MFSGAQYFTENSCLPWQSQLHLQLEIPNSSVSPIHAKLQMKTIGIWSGIVLADVIVFCHLLIRQPIKTRQSSYHHLWHTENCTWFPFTQVCDHHHQKNYKWKLIQINIFMHTEFSYYLINLCYSEATT